MPGIIQPVLRAPRRKKERLGAGVDAGVAPDAGVAADAGVAVGADVVADLGVVGGAGVVMDAGVAMDADVAPGAAGLFGRQCGQLIICPPPIFDLVFRGSRSRRLALPGSDLWRRQSRLRHICRGAAPNG
jgi:hypothetical protein